MCMYAHTHTYIYIYIYIYVDASQFYKQHNDIYLGWGRINQAVNNNRKFLFINVIVQTTLLFLPHQVFLWIIGMIVRVFGNGPVDMGSIPGRVIPKTQKMVLDATLLNTQHYKVEIKGKVEQSRKWSSTLPYLV